MRSHVAEEHNVVMNIWWRKSENGFTLAELLIVVAIIGKRSVLAERANLLP